VEDSHGGFSEEKCGPLSVRDGISMRETFLPFSPPDIGEEEIAEVVDTLRSDWITSGPKVKRFEADFAAYMARDSAVAFNSWTAAAHVALVCLGVGPGDEVIVPTMTFAATANIVEHVGARPILVDVEPDTLNIDPKALEAAITPRTVGIIPVHYAGHPVDLDAVRAIANKHHLFVLEDAAHALPSFHRGELIGSGNSIAAFSFYATKNLATAEGGMLVGPADLLEKARTVGLHGMSRAAWNRYGKGGNWKYDIEMPGFKYNMTDISAGLGIHQLRRLTEFQLRRRSIALEYDEGLNGLDGLSRPTVRPEVTTCWHLYVVRVGSGFRITRDELITEMAEQNIGTSVHFIPVHQHSFYKQKYGLRDEQFPNASAAFEEIISLPLSPRHTSNDISDVIETLHRIAQK
jgi:dTDP-4-amino-4,6-dideoxygalactose transaminase